MKTNTYRKRGIYLLPNLFTIGALFSGFFAIISAFKGYGDHAAMAIFLAMILDSLDGRVARLTNTMTNFGAVFDSLSDMVAFAVAPAILAYSWNLSSLGKIGLIVSFLYMVAIALRLARFNTQAETVGKKYFQGLPCPAGAAIVSSLVWICFDYEFTNQTTIWFLAAVMFFVAILMVSNIRYHSFKEVEFKKNVRFVAILIAVLIIALISINPEKVLFVIFAGYGISGPVGTIWGLRQKRRQRKATSGKHVH